MIDIVQNDDPVLRKIAKDVPQKSINSPKIQGVLGRMKEALDSQKDGVAIAAPQIGESLRIFVVSLRALDVPEDVDERRKQPKDTGKRYEKSRNKKSCLAIIPLFLPLAFAF